MRALGQRVEGRLGIHCQWISRTRPGAIQPEHSTTMTATSQNNASRRRKHLARRNLRRGYQLSLPTGQALARAVGVTPLSEADLRQGSSEAVVQALSQGGFFERTLLWYYILKEASASGSSAATSSRKPSLACW